MQVSRTPPRSFIAGQQDKLGAALKKAGVEPGPYALVDFPEYANVGDSAIWLGQIGSLRRYTGRSPAYVSTCTDSFNADDLKRAVPDGPILITGGGNFGDLWIRHQQFRYALMTAFPGRRIVQLSQSIQFENPAELAVTKDAIRQHGNFHLLVRDRRSFDLATDNFACETQLAPDFAFGMDPLTQHNSADKDILFLLRSDKEAQGEGHAALKGFPDAIYTDWLTDDEGPLRIARWRSRITSALRRRSAEESRLDQYNARAHVRLDRGVKLILSARRVVTDRLHVHILSTILGVPNIVLDNNYGKIHGYRDQWTKDVGTSVAVSSADEAAQLLRDGWGLTP